MTDERAKRLAQLRALASGKPYTTLPTLTDLGWLLDQLQAAEAERDRLAEGLRLLGGPCQPCSHVDPRLACVSCFNRQLENTRRERDELREALGHVVADLVGALEDLRDVQNGPPLVHEEESWAYAMNRGTAVLESARAALERWGKGDERRGG